MQAARVVVVCLLVAATAAAAPPPAAAPDDATELVLVALLSRDGVRPPLDSMNGARHDQALYAAQAWPSWPVPAGDLTPHGARLATLLGGYYRTFYAEGLRVLPPEPAAARRAVYVHADSFQPCIKTAQAFLEGLLPGGGVPVDALPTGPPDPLFHPTEAQRCPVAAAQRRDGVLGRIGGAPDGLTTAFAEPLRAVQDGLHCCAQSGCRPGATRCRLIDLEAHVTDDGEVDGPLRVAQTAAENFLLEAAEGLPAGRIGWGRVSRAALLDMLRVHTFYFDLVYGNQVAARAEASNLAAHLAASLQQAVTGGRVSGLPQGPETRVVAYFGHDTNIAALGGLLHLHWLTLGFQPDQTPPAGALVFELHRRRDTGAFLVRAFFISQTLDQMARATPLTAAAPPSRAPIAIPGCSGSAPGFDCDYETFMRIAHEQVDARCVDPGLAW